MLGIQTGPVCTAPLFLLIDPHILLQTSLFFKESVTKCLLQRMDFVFYGHEHILRSPWKLVLWGTPDCVLPESLQMFAWIANTSQNLSEMTLQVTAAGKEHNMHELGLLPLLKVLEAMKTELLGL